jgi:hypothetical protein
VVPFRGRSILRCDRLPIPVDRNAIQVKRIVYSSDNREGNPRLGEQFEYVSRELAEKLAPRVDRDGSVLMAWIMEITGGDDYESLRVNIQIEEYQPAEILLRKSSHKTRSLPNYHVGASLVGSGRHFLSPQFWPFETKSEFFNSQACSQPLMACHSSEIMHTQT